MIQTSFFPGDEPEKPIPIDPTGLQPMKMEDVLPDQDIQLDTYMFYPNGGYHFFYGTANTLPRYQLPIWPFVKRVKYRGIWLSPSSLTNIKKSSLREKTDSFQINPHLNEQGYLKVNLFSNKQHLKNDYTRQTKKGHVKHMTDTPQQYLLHRLVALAWIPNPNNKEQVMHLNDDRTNYLVENLQWGTARDNAQGKIKKRPDTMEQKYLNLVNKGIIKG
tara:strand:+ start:91 stop:744 length:654 start_codon:yes stop_codon:yes gene_type:complete